MIIKYYIAHCNCKLKEDCDCRDNNKRYKKLYNMKYGLYIDYISSIPIYDKINNKLLYKVNRDLIINTAKQKSSLFNKYRIIRMFSYNSKTNNQLVDTLNKNNMNKDDDIDYYYKDGKKDRYYIKRTEYHEIINEIKTKMIDIINNNNK